MSGQRAAEQADVQEITVPAAMDQIETVTDFVNGWLDRHECQETVQIQLDIAVDEVFSNIVRYAYGSGTGTATVRIGAEEETGMISITFIDGGTPFNPLEKEMPDTTGLRARERPIGGLGLFIIKKKMDRIIYDYQDGKNILTIYKKIH